MKLLDALPYIVNGQPAVKLWVACPTPDGRYYRDIEIMVYSTGKMSALRGTIAARSAVRSQIEALIRSL